MSQKYIIVSKTPTPSGAAREKAILAAAREVYRELVKYIELKKKAA